MNTDIRSTLSSATALGLVSFVATSAVVSSIAAPATVAGLGLLAVYGVVEIAIASYAGPRLVRRSTGRAAQVTHAAPAADLIAFPSNGRHVLARAA